VPAELSPDRQRTEPLIDRGYSRDLTALPEGATLRAVAAEPAVAGGRACLKVELLDEITRTGVPFVDYIDQPTFVVLPVELTTGRIEVDVLARLNAKTDFDARGFAGIAYRIDSADRFEAVYARALNGLRADAPPPRNERALQYFAHPDWLFDRLRDEYPGEYERPADIGPDEWFTLALELDDAVATASVDGVEALTVARPKALARRGRVGLFVDIGTEAYFSNLRVTARS
jgi:hypothetical protein